MANQAIALQARAPQTDFMGRAIQQNAQMMNMMSQRRASERQAAQAAQEMELARAAEGRAVTKAELDERKAQQEYMVGRVAYFRDQLPSVKDDVSWNNWLGRVGKEDPEYADELRRASGGRYDDDFVKRVSMDAKTFIDKNIATPSASLQYGEGGGAFGVTVGGMGSPRAQEVVVQPPAGAPAALAQPPMAEAPATGGVNARATQGTDTAPSDLMQQGVDPRSIPMGNPLRPASMTTGPQMGAEPDLAAVVQDMMQTKQVTESNRRMMLDVLPPESAAQFDQILKAQNIRTVPDAEPSMRSAVFRPGEDAAPQMQMAQAINRPGTQFRGRDPMQSPSQAPAVAGAVAEAQREPIPQAGARAQAQREPIPLAGARAAAERASPSEVAATERAKAQAEADVKFMERFQTDRDSTRQMISLINKMIGDTYVENNRLMVKKGGKQPAPGFEDVIGATWRPGFRFIPGTAAADFDAKQKQIEGGTFLEAFERLKGGGQITQPEGEKATRAISRMERSVSEVAYVEAARELENIIRTALKRAEDRYARLQGQKPAAQTGAPKRLRFNPATGGFE
jgi:hypothetical protein